MRSRDTQAMALKPGLWHADPEGMPHLTGKGGWEKCQTQGVVTKTSLRWRIGHCRPGVGVGLESEYSRQKEE